MASAALKAAAEKLDDVQRGAGELYAKLAEKASTKVGPSHAAVCLRSTSIVVVIRWPHAMLSFGINIVMGRPQASICRARLVPSSLHT